MAISEPMHCTCPNIIVFLHVVVSSARHFGTGMAMAQFTIDLPVCSTDNTVSFCLALVPGLCDVYWHAKITACIATLSERRHNLQSKT